MFRGRIAAVSYLNTVPFIYGIEHATGLRAALLLSPPNGCAAAFSNGSAEIALVPAGALPQIKDYDIVTPFCLGAVNPVRTVVMMSNSPLEEIRRIYLDPHSVTSALLVKIFCGEHWGISPQWEPLDDYSVADVPREGDAFLLIGDKVFDYEGRFRHTWDIAETWQRMTGLPSVFAVWVARKNVDARTVASLEEALGHGTRQIREAIAHYGHSGKPYAYDYLTKNIDYAFDAPKHKALTLFLELGRKFSPQMNPG